MFVEIVGAADFAGCSHQSHAVVLDQNCGPDHRAVQFRKPGTKRDILTAFTLLCRQSSYSDLLMNNRVFVLIKYVFVLPFFQSRCHAFKG